MKEVKKKEPKQEGWNKQVLERGCLAERVRERRDGVALEREGLQTNGALPRVRQLGELVAREVTDGKHTK